MRSICAGILLLCACAIQGQDAQRSFGAAETVLTPEVELPPRYQIEFIVFAHNRFDENEEYFDVVPIQSQFAPTDEIAPLRVFDDETRTQLRDLFEGPITAPPAEDTEVAGPGGIASDPSDDPTNPDLILEAYLDPRMVEGPNTRFLDLHELTLLTTIDRLNVLDAYTPLLHGGWEQNGLPEAEAVPIDLTEFDSLNPRGTIRLHMSRYLHITVDLAFSEAAQTAADTQPEQFTVRPLQPNPNSAFGSFLDFAEPQPSAEYFLLEQRRILRDELNYFDHPAFGVLLQITLAPEPETAPETDGPSA